MKTKRALLLFFVLIGLINAGFAKGNMNEYLPDESNVRLLGRTVYENNIAVLSHSASGVEFYVNAKKLTVTVKQDNMYRTARIVAFLNGKRIYDKMLKPGKNEIEIFSAGYPKEGVVQILKASECTVANLGIEKIATDKRGSISPTEAKDARIEFIGDSATAGYGVDEKNKLNHFKVETEDATKSWAFKAALALDADYSFVCASGWGVVSGSDARSGKEMLIPDIYGKVGINKSASVGGFKPAETDWDFSRFKPDIVVILLGANDQNYTQGDAEKCREFKDAYVKFIYDIRAKNPDTYILCCSGLAPDDLYPQIQEAVSEYQGKTGDKRVGEYHIPLHNGAVEGWGADYHPTDKAYSNAAHNIVPELMDILIEAE